MQVFHNTKGVRCSLHCDGSLSDVGLSLICVYCCLSDTDEAPGELVSHLK